MTNLTRSIGEFVAGIHYHDIPPEAISITKTGFSDCVAVMIAGQNEPAPVLVRRALSADGRAAEARIAFGDTKARAVDAALINGTAAHALDYDDVAMSAHPSAVLVPAILAEAEALGSNGRAVAAAYVAGYEVWAELAHRDRDSHHEKGWHPTSLFGVIGAAAAVATLHQLDLEGACAAIGIAASCAGGLSANFGTMTKPFHAGRAAQGGVLAARLAAQGMTAAADVIEHPLGFLAAISPNGAYDAETEPSLGTHFRIPDLGVNIKKYPMCYSTHRSLDGILDLLRERALRPEEIASIEVEMGDTQATILRNHRPVTGLEAKFSEEFAMASAVVAGRAGRAELSDQFVCRDDVQDLFRKVTVTTTTERDADDPAFAPDEMVKIRLSNGETLTSARIRYARGHARNPVRPEELWAKFLDCVGDHFTHETARDLYEGLQGMESLVSIADLPSGDLPIESGRFIP